MVRQSAPGRPPPRRNQPIECPFGHVQRMVTGGEGGIANVHVVKIKGNVIKVERIDADDGLAFSVIEA